MRSEIEKALEQKDRYMHQEDDLVTLSQRNEVVKIDAVVDRLLSWLIFERVWVHLLLTYNEMMLTQISSVHCHQNALCVAS